MSQAVYVMEDRNTHLLKIGISVDPEFRAEQVSRDFGCNATVLGILRVDDALKTEQFIHGMLADRRVVGEWFEVPAAQRGYLLAYFSERPEKLPRPIVRERRPRDLAAGKMLRARTGCGSVEEFWGAVREKMRQQPHGYQSRIAKELGVDRAYIHRFIKGDHELAPKYQQAVLDSVGIEIDIRTVKPASPTPPTPEQEEK